MLASRRDSGSCRTGVGRPPGILDETGNGLDVSTVASAVQWWSSLTGPSNTGTNGGQVFTDRPFGNMSTVHDCAVLHTGSSARTKETHDRPIPEGSDATPARPAPPWKIALGGLDEKMGVKILEESVERVVATMPVEGNRQSFGLLHGGASLAVGEAVGSWAAVIDSSALGKTAVGVDVSATHHRSAREGMITITTAPHPSRRDPDHPRSPDHQRGRPAALHPPHHQPADEPEALGQEACRPPHLVHRHARLWDYLMNIG